MHTEHLPDYTLHLEVFQGPLHKLLELIEKEALEITEISLAKVTGDFLEYVEQLSSRFEGQAKGERTAVPPHFLADFLVVASQLLLIKSKALLPSLEVSEEEEEDMRFLESRLKLYRELKESQSCLREMWHDVPRIASREFFSGAGPLFYPPRGITPRDLASSLVRVAGEIEHLFRPQATVKREIINLRIKIEEVVNRLSSTPVSFRAFHGGKSKTDLVALFLAILHLVKKQLVQAEQGSHFSDFTIARRGEVEYNE